MINKCAQSPFPSLRGSKQANSVGASPVTLTVLAVGAQFVIARKLEAT